MEGLSIEELLAGLQQAQEAKSTVKLSERNIVELVNKLKELELLTTSEVLHTINGKEYITRERVTTEVEGAVRQAGGRISLVDLPPALGVDLIHCESAAQKIAEQSSGKTLIVQGEIITTDYFDNLAVEVDGELQETGAVAISDLARKSHLSAELLLTYLSSRIGDKIRGRLEGGLIYTQAHVDRIKARLRGLLRGCTAPTLVHDLLKGLSKHCLQKSVAAEAVDPSLISAIVEELIKEGSIKGTIKGGGANWLPDIYRESQLDAVRTFYSQNGYLDYDHAAKMGIQGAGAKSELSELLPDSLALDTAVVSPALVDQLEASVEDALSTGSWVDVHPLVPTVLSVEDAASLLQRCSSAQPLIQSGGKAKGSRVLASTCVISGAFLKELSDKYAVEARAAASEAANERRKATAHAASTAAAPEAEGGKKGGKGSKSSAAAAASAAVDEDEDDWNFGKKGKKGGKKGKGVKGGKGAGPAGKGQSGAGGDRSAAEDGTRLRAPTAAKIAERLAEWYPDLAEPAGDADDLSEVVAAELVQAAVMEYETALSAAFTVGSEERRRRRDDLAKILETSAAHLALFGKGAAVLEDDEETSVAVQRHVLRTAATETLDLLLRYEELQVDEVELPEDPKPKLGISAAERKTILALLPADIQAPTKTATDALNGSSVTDALGAIDQAASSAGLRLKRHDKKAEKAAVADFQKRLTGQLDAETDPVAALALVVPLLFVRTKGKLISVPGKAITGVIAHLQDDLPEEAYELVMKFHQDVVSFLKAKSDDADTTTKEELLATLPFLKEICAPSQAG